MNDSVSVLGRQPSEAVRQNPKTDAATPSAGVKYEFIDVLRGTAILLVILVHIASGFPLGSAPRDVAVYGQFGVQLFFVVSAFTLCLSAGGKPFETRNALVRFYIRRICRIAPLYYCGIAGYFVVCWMIEKLTGRLTTMGSVTEYRAMDVAAHLFFWHGLSPSAYIKIVPGGWSIGTEWAFYALFPLLLFLLRKGKIWIVSAAVLNTVLFLALIQLFRNEFKPWLGLNKFLYLNIACQLPAFLWGMLAYRIHAENPIFSTREKTILWAAALLPWVAVVALYQGNDDVGLLAAPGIAGLSFAAFLLLLRDLHLPMRWMAAVGTRSFSMYINHFVLAWISVRYMRLSCEAVGPYLAGPIWLALVAAASYACAELMYRFIELPGIAAGRRLVRRFADAH